MRKMIKLLGTLGCMIFVCLLAPIILTVALGILGFTTISASTLGIIFLLLSPGIIIGIIIGSLQKENKEENK